MTHIFPLIANEDTETLTLEIDAAETAKTVGFSVNSRKVLINAQGANAAPTYTVEIDAPVGMFFLVEITSLNSNSGTTASKVIFSKAGSTATFDTDSEKACIFVDADGKLKNGTNILGSVFGTSSAGVLG